MLHLLLLKNLRDLRASLAQTIALIIIVALGVASYVALIGAYRDLATSYNHTYEQLAFADVTFALDSAPSDVVNQIAKIPGVAAVTGRLIVDTGLDLPPELGGVKNAQIRARLIGIPEDAHPRVNDVLVESGRYFQPRDGKVALLETHFASIYNLAPGATVTPIINGRKQPLQVIGTIASPEYLVVSASRQDVIPSARSFAVIFVPEAELDRLMGGNAGINNIAVRFASDANPDNVIQQIDRELNAYEINSTTLQADQASNAALHLDLEGYREIGFMMPALILFVAAVSLYVMLGRLIRAQQAQIGLMKALGYADRAIVVHYLGLALLIGIVGTLLGVALGIPLGSEITTEYATELGIPLVATQVYPDLMVEGAILSIVLALLGGLVPALQASRLPPVVAMRPSPQMFVKGGRTWIERVVRLPLWLRVALRNVLRVRSRSLSTGLGILFAFVLVLGAWSFMDSMQFMLQDTFQNVERWDVMAVYSTPHSWSTLHRIESMDGVKRVEPILLLPATIKGGGASEDIAVTAIDPAQTLHRLELENGITPAQALGDNKIVLTAALANKYHLRVGDPVTMVTQAKPGSHEKITRTLTLGGIADEMMSAVGYISLDEGSKWANITGFAMNGAYVQVNTSQASAIRSALYDDTKASSVQLKSAVQADWVSLMGLFYAFIGMLVVFALAMTFALLFNTMTVNVLEQQRELATMRAIGTNRRKILLMMMGESVIVWLLALIPGLVLGTLAARELGGAFQTDLFALNIVIAPTSYVVAALGILLTMLLAALPAIRRVNKLNLAEATKTLT